MGDGIGLEDAIDSLRQELTAAVGKGDGQHMRFRLDPIVLELQVVVTKVGQGKIGWKIVELGGSYTSASTQKLTLKLTPEWSKDGKAYSTDFRVSASMPTHPEQRDQPEQSTHNGAGSGIDEGVEKD